MVERSDHIVSDYQSTGEKGERPNIMQHKALGKAGHLFVCKRSLMYTLSYLGKVKSNKTWGEAGVIVSGAKSGRPGFVMLRP